MEALRGATAAKADPDPRQVVPATAVQAWLTRAGRRAGGAGDRRGQGEGGDGDCQHAAPARPAVLGAGPSRDTDPESFDTFLAKTGPAMAKAMGVSHTAKPYPAGGFAAPVSDEAAAICAPDT